MGSLILKGVSVSPVCFQNKSELTSIRLLYVTELSDQEPVDGFLNERE